MMNPVAGSALLITPPGEPQADAAALTSQGDAQPGHPRSTVLSDKVGAPCRQDGRRARAGQWHQEGRTGRCLSPPQEDRASGCPWTRFMCRMNMLQVVGQSSDGDRAADIAPERTPQSRVPAVALVFSVYRSGAKPKGKNTLRAFPAMS